MPASLGGLARWGDDLIDRWDGSRWLRIVRTNGHAVAARIRSIGSLERPSLEVELDGRETEAVARELEHTFVQAQVAMAGLVAVDPAVAAADAEFPGVRPLLTHDPLTALVRSISAQQVNLRWAAEVRRRLAQRFGVAHGLAGEVVFELDAAALSAATVEEMRALQLTTVKAKSVIAVANAALEGSLSPDELGRLDDEAVIAALTRIFGIGRWSAEWFLARTLGRPRVVAGDLGVRKAVGRAYFKGRMPTEAEVRAATEHWGAAAGVAQQLLLNTLLSPPRSGPPAP